MDVLQPKAMSLTNVLQTITWFLFDYSHRWSDGTPSKLQTVVRSSKHSHETLHTSRDTFAVITGFPILAPTWAALV